MSLLRLLLLGTASALIAAGSPAEAACNYIACIGGCVMHDAGGCGVRRAFCAAQCSRGGGGGTTYGAIAYSPSSGRVGYSYNFANRSAADARASQECGKPDCVIATWYYNNCGAVAASSTGAWAGEHAASTRRAEALAMARCEHQGGRDCKVLASHCATQ